MTSIPFLRPTNPLDRRSLGKYELLCRLSTGGMSEIFLAHQKGLAGFKKVVVLKSILPDIRGEEDFVKMFLDEARITSQLTHPNIAQVFDLDTADGMLFLSMEFVQGCTLVEMARACRQAKEPIPIGFTLGAVRDTALALHYAHNFTDTRGRRNVVIHRDVAEKNIMVTYEGVTKLLDFGIAKALGKRTQAMTSIGMVKGTSGYMSPEQIRGEPLDQRSDIFSLGVVLHECLTGMRLFHGKSPEEGMLAALREDAPRPSKQNPQVSSAIDQVTLKALARDKDHRYKSALDFARELEKACPGEIWYPEQSGELVQRHFADRRTQTRDLIESSQEPHELTGEVHLNKVMAAVQGRAEPVGPPKIDIAVEMQPRRGPPPPPVEEETVRKMMGGPVVTPMPQRRDSKPTIPAAAGGRVVTEPNAALLPERTNTGDTNTGDISISLTPAEPYFDDDDDGKTIPAAALPEELLKLQRSKAQTKPQPAAKVITPAAVPRMTRGSVPAVKPPPPVPSHPNPSRSITDETASVPGRKLRTDFVPDDDEAEPGVRTTLSRPFEVLKEPQPQKGLTADDLFDDDETSEPTGDDIRVDEPLDRPTGDISGLEQLPDEGDAASTFDPSSEIDAPITSSHKVGRPKALIFGGAGALVVAIAVAVFALKPFSHKDEEPVGKATPLFKKEQAPEPAKKEAQKEAPKKEDPPPPKEQQVAAKDPEPQPKKVEAEQPPPPAKKEDSAPKVAKGPPPEKAPKAPPPPKQTKTNGKKPKVNEEGDAPPAKEVVLADVSLVVDPPVTVMWNGKALGKTPLKTQLPVGKQSLKLMAPDGPAKNIIVDVKEAGTALRYDLEDL
ncbi:MAG: serine/threonine-protein kinase [Myxococcaceae bacterium]